MPHFTAYTQIRRGPMGGDHYTQIHNWVFRDRTLTPNAKAIFGWISTHAQGWRTGIDVIGDEVGIGRDATRAALILLKRRHYLVHGRERSPAGTLGAGWYFLTDLPAQLAEAGVTDDTVIAQAVDEALEHWKRENGRSEPGWQIQYPGESGEFSQVGTKMAKTRNLVQPDVAVRPPKKTIELQENQGEAEDQRSKHSSSQATTAIQRPPHDLDHGDFETAQTWLEDQLDGLDGAEINMALAMWDRDDPILKIARAIRNQREHGYSRRARR